MVSDVRGEEERPRKRPRASEGKCETAASSKALSDTNLIVREFEYGEGKRYAVAGDGTVRRILEWTFGKDYSKEILGPVVGAMDLATDELELDEVKFSGEFVGELLDSTPIDAIDVKWTLPEAIKEKVNKRACDALGKGDSVVVIENVLDCDSIAKARSSMLKMLEERCLSRVAHGQSSAVRDDKVAFVSTAFLQRDMQLNLGDVYDGFDDEEEEKTMRMAPQ